MSLNSRLASASKRESSAIFWHKVFMARPPHKNPGFKIDRVDWRKLLLKKDNETKEKEATKF